MDKESLIKSASELPIISQTAYEEYEQEMENLVASINARILNHHLIEELIGNNELSLLRTNHANHVRFMLSIFISFNPKVLVETVEWVFRAYLSRGFNPRYWEVQLTTWLDILAKELSPNSSKQITPYYAWMLENISNFVALARNKARS